MRSPFIVSALCALALIGEGVAAPAPYLRDPTCGVPDSDPPGPADVVVTTAMAGWSAVRQQITAGTRQVLLTPGDYQSWGQLDVGPTWPSGTRAAPFVVRYYDPATESKHPVERRVPATEAVINGIIWWGDVHDWVVHGLTIRAPDVLVTGGMLHILNADRITLDGNLVENSPMPYGVRVRDSRGACVQRNVIRNSTNAQNDNVGIDVKPNQEDVRGVRILDNLVVNWIDSVQFTQQTTMRASALVRGNHFITTPARHVTDPDTGLVYGCTENAIDIKVLPYGSGIRIIGNLISGWRETPPVELAADLCGFLVVNGQSSSGSAGDAIVVHIDGGGVMIANNVIRDSVAALRGGGRVGGRQLSFLRNRVIAVPPDDASTRFYGGAALVVEDDVTVNGNVFDGVPLLCPVHGFPYQYWPSGGWQPRAPRIGRNYSTASMENGACPAGTFLEDAAWSDGTLLPSQ